MTPTATVTLTPTPTPKPAVDRCDGPPAGTAESSARALQGQPADFVHVLDDFSASTGDVIKKIGVDRFRGSNVVHIEPMWFPDPQNKSTLPRQIATFREAMQVVFGWLKSQGICVADLQIGWVTGDPNAAQFNTLFQAWMAPSARYPEVGCVGGACSFVTPPALAQSPEQALEWEFAGPNWKGACSPPDGSGMDYWDECYRRQEQRGDVVQFALLVDQPPARGGPRLDTYIVYVRQRPNGWDVVDAKLCADNCPWPP